MLLTVMTGNVSTSSGCRLLGVGPSLVGSPGNAVVFRLVVCGLLCCDPVNAGLYPDGVLIGHLPRDDVVEREGGCFRPGQGLNFRPRLKVTHLERRNKRFLHVFSMCALSHSVVEHVLQHRAFGQEQFSFSEFLPYLLLPYLFSNRDYLGRPTRLGLSFDFSLLDFSFGSGARSLYGRQSFWNIG